MICSFVSSLTSTLEELDRVQTELVAQAERNLKIDEERKKMLAARRMRGRLATPYMPPSLDGSQPATPSPTGIPQQGGFPQQGINYQQQQGSVAQPQGGFPQQGSPQQPSFQPSGFPQQQGSFQTSPQGGFPHQGSPQQPSFQPYPQGGWAPSGIHPQGSVPQQTGFQHSSSNQPQGPFSAQVRCHFGIEAPEAKSFIYSNRLVAQLRRRSCDQSVLLSVV